LNKIDNGLSNKPKCLNKMFTFILAIFFLVKNILFQMLHNLKKGGMVDWWCWDIYWSYL